MAPDPRPGRRQRRQHGLVGEQRRRLLLQPVADDGQRFGKSLARMGPLGLRHRQLLSLVRQSRLRCRQLALQHCEGRLACFQPLVGRLAVSLGRGEFRSQLLERPRIAAGAARGLRQLRVEPFAAELQLADGGGSLRLPRLGFRTRRRQHLCPPVECRQLGARCGQGMGRRHRARGRRRRHTVSAAPCSSAVRAAASAASRNAGSAPGQAASTSVPRDPRRLPWPCGPRRRRRHGAPIARPRPVPAPRPPGFVPVAPAARAACGSRPRAPHPAAAARRGTPAPAASARSRRPRPASWPRRGPHRRATRRRRHRPRQPRPPARRPRAPATPPPAPAATLRPPGAGPRPRLPLTAPGPAQLGGIGLVRQAFARHSPGDAPGRSRRSLPRLPSARVPARSPPALLPCRGWRAGEMVADAGGGAHPRRPGARTGPVRAPQPAVAAHEGADRVPSSARARPRARCRWGGRSARAWRRTAGASISGRSRLRADGQIGPFVGRGLERAPETWPVGIRASQKASFAQAAATAVPGSSGPSTGRAGAGIRARGQVRHAISAATVSAERAVAPAGGALPRACRLPRGPRAASSTASAAPLGLGGVELGLPRGDVGRGGVALEGLHARAMRLAAFGQASAASLHPARRSATRAAAARVSRSPRASAA